MPTNKLFAALLVLGILTATAVTVATLTIGPTRAGSSDCGGSN